MKRAFVALSFIFASLFLAHPAHATGESRIRLIHASPDAPSVDILVNDSVAIEDLAFGTVTDYKTLPSGTYTIKVRPANSNSPDVISTSVTLRSGRDYTVAALNKLSSIKAQVYEDRNLLASDSRAKLRVIHMSPGAPAVDIALKNRKVLIHGLSYEHASQYLRLKPGSYDLEVRVANTQTVVLNLPGVRVDAGKVYQVYAVGVVGGTPDFGVRLSTTDALKFRNWSTRHFEIHTPKFTDKFEREFNNH